MRESERVPVFCLEKTSIGKGQRKEPDMLRYQAVCKFKYHGENEAVVRQGYRTLEKAMSTARPK